MRNKIKKHPFLMAGFSVIFVLTAFIGSNVVAGIQDRSSDVDLTPAPDNYIRLPDVKKPSEFIPPRDRVLADPPNFVSGVSSDPKQTGRLNSRTPPSGEIWLGNDEGNLMLKGEVQLAIAGKTVVIDSIDDLTYLSGGSGNSIFWMDWGNHYIVDPYAISFSGGTIYPIAGSTSTGISAVSGIFRSVLEKDDQKTITLEIAQTGTSGWAHLMSGTTPVTVWAPLNSGATTYGSTDADSGVTAVNEGDSGVTTQTLLLAPNEITPVNTGGFDDEVKFLGDQKTWKANYLAGVSVTPVKKTLVGSTAIDSGLSGTTATGFTIIGPSQGNTFLIDIENTEQIYTGYIDGAGNWTTLGVGAMNNVAGGVTVNVPIVTKMLDGWEITIGKQNEAGLASGVTEIVPYGTAVGTESGATPGDSRAAIILDDVGDTVTLKASYDTGVSWYIIGYSVAD